MVIIFSYGWSMLIVINSTYEIYQLIQPRQIGMCGNDLSSIVSPTTDFYTLVSTQVPSAKINIRNYPLNQTHANQLQTMNIRGIKQLSITKCKLTSQSLQEIATISLPFLTNLNLSDNEIGLIGCRILAETEFISSLVELNLNNNKIRDVGLKALAQADLQNIQDLSLSDNGISSVGVQNLKGKLPNVECLSLGGNKLNDSSVAIINQISPQTIYYLKLSRNELSDEGVKKVIDSHKKLQVLLVDRNKVRQGRDKFKKSNLFVFY